METNPKTPAEQILFVINATPISYFTRDWEVIEKEIDKLKGSPLFGIHKDNWPAFLGSVKIVAKALWLQVPHGKRK